MSEKSHFQHFMRELTRILAKSSGIYGGIFHDVFLLISGISGLQVPKELQRDSIEKRLNRLDEARDALSDTLTAVTELRDEIEDGKREHQHVLAELSRTLASKESADSKLENLRKLVETDHDTLREVTAHQNVARQHTIGFFLGVLASLVAAGLIYAAPIAREAIASWNTAEVLSNTNAQMLRAYQFPKALRLMLWGVSGYELHSEIQHLKLMLYIALSPPLNSCTIFPTYTAYRFSKRSSHCNPTFPLLRVGHWEPFT